MATLTFPEVMVDTVQLHEPAEQIAKLQKPVRLHTCSICQRTFKRSEHCTRHERGHTHEKPFPCNHCGRRYARKDLVSRHEKSFHPFELARRKQVISDEETIIVASTSNSEEVDDDRAPKRIHREPSTNHHVLKIYDAHFGEPHLNSPPVTTAQENARTISHPTEEQYAAVLTDLPMPSPGQFSWRESDTLDGDEFAVVDPQIISDGPPLLGRQMGKYFQDVDIFSMLPNGGTNLETDFSISSYLFNSGYSPPIETSPRHRWDENENEKGRNGLTASKHDTSPASTGSHLVGAFSRLPTVVNETPRKIALPVVDDEIHSLIAEDVKRRLSPNQVRDFKMPSAQAMQRFITSYFTCFHRHFPVVHLPSLDLRNTPSPLILSLCAIGALYRLSRKTAKDLWFWTDVMVELELETTPPNLPGPIAAVQCKLLLSLFAVFSGDQSTLLTEGAIAKLGYWTTEYRLRRAELALSSSRSEKRSWSEWSLRETSKRLLYGIFIMSSLMTVTYDMTPGFSVTQDLELEMPDEERLWEATTASQWSEWESSRRGPRVPITVRDAMTHLIFGKEHSSLGADPMNWSAFATTVILHTVNVHMWNIMQFTQSFTTFAVDQQNNTDLRACLTAQVETSLARCYNLLTADRSEREHTSDDSEGPLIFNCLALLRSAYVRVFTGAGSFNRMMLLSDDADQITNSMQSYVAGTQERSAFLTKAVSKAYEGLLTPIKAGYLLVRKTAALSWSVEHAIAAWDCALFVTKWIHSMEIQQQYEPPDTEEMKNLVNFRELLTEVDSEYDGKGSLAAEVTRIWACFLDDTWVWGITPRMGHVLRKLSSAFAEDWKLKFPNGNKNGPISR